MLYSKSDSLIIEHFLGSKFLGFYGAAYRYLESINLFATAIFHNLFPVASKKNNLSFFNLMRIVVFMFGISLFFSCFLYFGAELLTIVILGAEYLPSKEIVQIFALLIILFFTNSPLITTIAASSQLKKFLPWASINTLFNIIVNLLVVDTYGIKGIAWTMVASEILAIIINVVFIYKIYFKNETN